MSKQCGWVGRRTHFLKTGVTKGAVCKWPEKVNSDGRKGPLSMGNARPLSIDIGGGG